jgi:histidine ammonia-lyase
VVRAMMLLRARTLATGYCGARPKVAECLIEMLNDGVTPEVPEHGSLGCSGDLAPLAHVALALIDRGLELAAKEGLSLINGTDGMLGMLVLACHDARLLFQTADVAAALTVEALLGTDRVFHADLQRLRPHPGQAASAANMVVFWPGRRWWHRTAGTTSGYRTPTQCAAPLRWPGPPGTHSPLPSRSRAGS